MKKLSILTLLLMMATFVFANNNEPETNEERINIEKENVQQDDGDAPGTYYYGAKAGVFRPCKGNLENVCKKIIYSGNERGKVIVTDGVTTITVDISRVNFEDGSVEM